MCLMYFACLLVGEVAWSSHGDHILVIQQVHFSISRDTNKPTSMTITFHSFKQSKGQQPSLTIPWMSNTYYNADTVIYRRRPQCMLMIVDHRACIVFPHFPFVSMYHRRPRCMLMIVDHRACIVFPHFPFVSMYRHRPQCMLMIVDHRACIVFPHFPFVSMYRRRPQCMLMIVDHRSCIITHVTSMCKIWKN